MGRKQAAAPALLTRRDEGGDSMGEEPAILSERLLIICGGRWETLGPGEEPATIIGPLLLTL